MLGPIVAVSLVLSALTAHAQAQSALTIDCENPTFAKDSSHERLVAAFGKDNVTIVQEPGPKGMPPNVKSVIYPKDAKRRLEVSWHDGTSRARPFSFNFEKPSQWVAPKGVRVGTTLEELEKLNGKPFHIAGFGGLRDGMAMFTGALDKAPGGCSVGGSLETTVKLPKRTMDKISGDDDFPSTHPIVRQAKPRLHQVDVVYQDERKTR
jgi:hypothetical protein